MFINTTFFFVFPSPSLPLSVFSADMLFQFIIRQTQTKVSSSSYGLAPVTTTPGNGVHHKVPGSTPSSEDASSSSSQSDKKTN